MQKGADRCTDRNDEVNGLFRNFSIAPKKKVNYLIRLRADCLLCDDVSFQFSELLPKHERGAIENNSPLHHIRQLINLLAPKLFFFLF